MRRKTRGGLLLLVVVLPVFLSVSLPTTEKREEKMKSLEPSLCLTSACVFACVSEPDT